MDTLSLDGASDAVIDAIKKEIAPKDNLRDTLLKHGKEVLGLEAMVDDVINELNDIKEKTPDKLHISRTNSFTLKVFDNKGNTLCRVIEYKDNKFYLEDFDPITNNTDGDAIDITQLIPIIDKIKSLYPHKCK